MNRHDAVPLQRARRLALYGAVTLWLVSPLLIGAWVTTAVHLADGGPVGSITYAAMAAGAIVCLLVLGFGFACVMGGVYLWWRSRNPRRMPPTRDAARAARRAVVLREVQEGLRASGEATAADATVDATAGHPVDADARPAVRDSAQPQCRQ